MIQSRIRIVVLALATLLPLGAGVGLLVKGAVRRGLTEGEIIALARAQRFDEAARGAETYLRRHPNDMKVRLILAGVELDRPDPRPDRALTQLHAIVTGDPRKEALVKFYEGRAYHRQALYDRAETAWNEALKLDPRVPEAGWALFDLLDLEGRADDAHRLGLRLHETEPHPRDRVRILLELSRIDVDKVAPWSVVQLLAPLVRRDPENLALAVSLGTALIRDSRADEGITVLRDALARHPEDPGAWDALLTGLDEAGQTSPLIETFAKLPKALARDPRFAQHEGRVAQERRDWRAAAEAYGRAFAFRPYRRAVLYRYARALRLAENRTEADRIDRILAAHESASKQMREVYEKTLAIKSLGIVPDPERYQHLAALREQMGRPDEARAWHRLVLRDDPSNATSLAALERLRVTSEEKN